MPLSCTCKNREMTAMLSGEIDHPAAKELMAGLDHAIGESLPLRLTLDMSGVTFMDSSGLAVLMRCKRRMDELKGSMQVVSIPAQPLRVMDAAGIGRLIPLE